MTRTITIRHEASGRVVTLTTSLDNAAIAHLFPGWTLIAGTVLHGRRHARIAR